MASPDIKLTSAQQLQLKPSGRPHPSRGDHGTAEPRVWNADTDICPVHGAGFTDRLLGAPSRSGGSVSGQRPRGRGQ